MLPILQEVHCDHKAMSAEDGCIVIKIRIIHYLQAMLHFLRRYPTAHFLVMSDDRDWCRSQLAPASLAPLVTVPGGPRSAPGDLAALSLCNHTIASVGTYSWWGAWLAGGDVVMYAQPIRR